MRAVTWSRHQEIVSLDEGRKGEQCEFRILEVQMFDAGIGCGTHVISQQEGHFLTCALLVVGSETSHMQKPTSLCPI